MIDRDAEFEACSFGATDVGCIRELNEDFWLLDDRTEIWAVADGMGGHERGDYASQCVVSYLSKVRSSWPNPRSLTLDIEHRLEEANRHLREESRRSNASNIGSTVACVAKYKNHALVVWTGDSRVYLLRAGQPMQQVTRDQTIVQDLIDAGKLDVSEAEDHPMANVITGAVGVQDELILEFEQVRLSAGDKFLLCSDGLSRTLSDNNIEEIVRASPSDQAPVMLVEETLNNGAPDNVTAIIVEIRKMLL